MRPAAYLRLQACSSIMREPTATLKPPSIQARSASVIRTRIAPHRLYGQQEGTFAGSLSFPARLTAISLTYCPTGAEPTTTGHRSRARRVGQVNVANRRRREPTSGLEPLTS